ncbi:DUF7010 family protein [Clostridium algidicarnis]|uniref:DUF7010 family protein n=1 Tax=Clostridium algidicarnis TaxID=37659 RepID=UPI001C0B1A56|nr:hypothetical protein [Clostridium algidicarnis]MBU3204946.1 hypothetical protein [Clostridium algidicarnis]MBU3213100.1 hypothetical protein [Clostridium algidicarnis]MBU3223756.1 hypothetical protein [Clostridium algidicarnis]
MNLDQLRMDIAKRSKKGIHFIIASVIIWCAVLVVWLLPIKNIITKNLLTFCFTTPLLPLAYMISKIIKAEFSVKDNPLNKLGILFSYNQFLYILIAMWVYPTVPDKMVMVLAVIFGAHLMPFGWLYKSKAYSVMSVIISFSIFIIGIMFNAVIVSIIMITFEVIFCFCLIVENKTLNVEELT